MGDFGLLADTFCNSFHTFEPSLAPTTEPTISPSTAAPTLSTKAPHKPTYAPIWLTNTGWGSFQFFSSPDCASDGYVATESVPSNLCVATSWGSYKYRFQQSGFKFLILFSNYSDSNCKNVRLFNHVPMTVPIQSCVAVSSLVSTLPYFADMSNMFVNVSIGVQSDPLPQTVIKT